MLTVIGVVAATPFGRPFINRYLPQPAVVVDNAMRMETIDQLVAELNDHYIFPDKARQMSLTPHIRLVGARRFELPTPCTPCGDALKSRLVVKGYAEQQEPKRKAASPQLPPSLFAA